MKASAAHLVGLDTSFVLRLLIGEPAAQAKRALAQMDKFRSEGRLAAISDLVLSEAYFALQHHYDVPKQAALDALKCLLESAEVVSMGYAAEVLQEANLGKTKPGFVDRLIHAGYLHGASGMVTFEKAAAKLPKVSLPT